MRCAESGSISIAALLLERGADSGAASGVGMVAAQIAVICEHDDLAEFLDRRCAACQKEP
jgi:hypothetical protein